MRKVIDSHKQLLVKVILVLAALMITKVMFEVENKRGILKPEYSGMRLK